MGPAPMPPVDLESAGRREDPERFDPAASAGLLIDAEHRARYWAAAALAAGRRVLDAGCGTGYGTEILVEAGAASVDAIDISDEALAATRERVGDRVEAQRADLHELPFADGHFDLVVCFEVIEHVGEQGEALAELRRVLAPGGILIISSPNRLVYAPGNPHHVHEFTPDELESALREHFAEVVLHRQHVWLASALLDDAAAATPQATLAGETRLLEPLAPGEETYTVALASDGALPALPAEVALSGTVEVRWFAERIAYLENRVAEVERQRTEDIERLMRDVDRARTALEAADKDRRDLRDALLDLSSANAQIPDLQRRLTEVREERVAYEEGVHGVLAARDAEIERLGGVIAGMENSISWKLTRPVRAIKRSLRRA
jgi:SAM-dependent methyltransferase